MVSRTKDVKALNKHLLKRYSSEKALASSDRKLLDVLVYALFLENGNFERSLESFDRLERYFIDWNEIRVAKAEEIAEVIGDYKGAVRDGERLRRLLQSLFDLTFRFDLEEYRTKDVDSLAQFLGAIPYSTPFMIDFVRFFAFREFVLPCSEGMFRALRALNLVAVQGDMEVAVLPQKRFTYDDLFELFVVLFQFGVDLANPDTRDAALKFLASFDKAALSRSVEPLVASKWPSDPREIARLLSHKEKMRKSPSTLKDDVKAEACSDDEDERESYDEQDESTMEVGEETTLTMTSESVSSTTVPEEVAPKPKRQARPKDESTQEVAKKVGSVGELKGSDVPKRSSRSRLKAEKPLPKEPVAETSAPIIQQIKETSESQEVAEPEIAAPKKSRASRAKKVEPAVSLTDGPVVAPESAKLGETEQNKPKSRVVKKKSAKPEVEKATPKGASTKKTTGKKSKDSISKKKIENDGVVTATQTKPALTPADEKVAKSKKKKTKPVDGGSVSKSVVNAPLEEPVKEVKAPKKSTHSSKKTSGVVEAESVVKIKKKTVKPKNAKVKDSQAEPPDDVPATTKKKRVRKVANGAESDGSVKARASVSKETNAPKKKRGNSKSSQDDESRIQEIQQKKPR